jgi:dienelactone hydrolase
LLFILPFLPLLLVAITPPVYQHLRATSALLEIAGLPEPAILKFDSNPVVREEISIPSSMPVQPLLRARIYHPVGVAHPSPVVVVHGVHHLGIDEPRLCNFAASLASHGYLVMTPQIDSLADYRLTLDSAATIDDAVHELARRSGAKKVGLLGLSFAGGMALIGAAEDESVQRQLSGIIAIGAHDDLEHVLQYYESDQARAPDGSLFHMKAHEYGALVTVYGFASHYFSPQDAPQAEITLRALLWEDLPRAHAEAAKLSPAGQARMAQLFDHDTKSLIPETERMLKENSEFLRAASPHYYLSKLHVPVLLLAGAGDNVVPPTETLWLERDLPPAALKAALISPCIGHVEIGEASVLDKFRLVHWMAEMLDTLDTAAAERG